MNEHHHNFESHVTDFVTLQENVEHHDKQQKKMWKDNDKKQKEVARKASEMRAAELKSKSNKSDDPGAWGPKIDQKMDHFYQRLDEARTAHKELK